MDTVLDISADVNASQYGRSGFLVPKPSTFKKWENFPSSYCDAAPAI